MRPLFGLPLILLGLGGCGVGTLVNVATAPVRLTSKAIDLATTSQSEADENRGRDLRRMEGRYGQLERDYSKAARRCAAGSEQSCAQRQAIGGEMDALRPKLPAQSD